MKTYQKEADKFNIEGLRVLTPYHVHCLIVSAMEGGSNYWYEIKNKSYDRIIAATMDMEGQPFEDRMIMAVQRGTTVNIYDVENGEKLGKLTPQSWANAEKLMIKDHRIDLGHVLSESDDAITGDIFFQLAVIGEVIYG